MLVNMGHYINLKFSAILLSRWCTTSMTSLPVGINHFMPHLRRWYTYGTTGTGNVDLS